MLELTGESSSVAQWPFLFGPSTAGRVSLREKVTVRAFDLIVSVTGLVVLAPLFLVLIALVRLSSPGPALYRSPRIGSGGTTFGVLKFRSMVCDADAALGRILAADATLRREYDRTLKLKDDPRITPVGRFLRRTNLDELPQLWNIARGQMSVVGPRPKLLGEDVRYGTSLGTVLRVKPGLTGSWQVSGRNDLDFERRIELDVEYALNRSLLGDIAICLKTAWLMLRPSGNGAY